MNSHPATVCSFPNLLFFPLFWENSAKILLVEQTTFFLSKKNESQTKKTSKIGNVRGPYPKKPTNLSHGSWLAIKRWTKTLLWKLLFPSFFHSWPGLITQMEVTYLKRPEKVTYNKHPSGGHEGFRTSLVIKQPLKVLRRSDRVGFRVWELHLPLVVPGKHRNSYLAILLVTFLGWWKRDPFEWLSDLQLGDEKVTKNHLVPMFFRQLVRLVLGVSSWWELTSQQLLSRWFQTSP